MAEINRKISQYGIKLQIVDDEELWNTIRINTEPPSHILFTVTDTKRSSVFQDVVYSNLITGRCKGENMLLKHDQEINPHRYIQQINRY